MYDSLIGSTAEKVLALAATTRGALKAASEIIANTNLALGTAVIDATHAMIGADVKVSYGLAAAAPASARATVALLGNTGNALAGAAARIPALATAAYLHTTSAPARIAPAIAQAVFDAEYAGAAQFVAATDHITSGYALALRSAGEAGYESAKSARNLATNIGSSPLVVNTRVAMNDAYLGALGKTALAFETFWHSPMLAPLETRTRGVLAAVQAASLTGLAAVFPALTIGEKIALGTYEAIQRFINNTGSVLAFLFKPTPIIVTLPSRTPQNITTNAKPTLSGSTVPVEPPPSDVGATTYNLFPTTYSGISPDLLNQSLAQYQIRFDTGLAALRLDVFSAIAANSTRTIITRFSDARSGGVFNGGIFDSGSMTNGVSVAATDGIFTNLTGGTTTLGTTTITNLSVTNTSTSTFAGSLAIGTTTPWGDGLFTVGTSSPLLHISSNTGNVGINTLASSYRLDVNGTLRAASDAYFNTNTTLGSATTTDVTYFNSRIADSLIPTADNVLDLGDPTNWLRWRTGYFGTSVGIAGTATSTGVSLLASGAYLVDSGSTLSINTTNNQPVSFGTGNVNFPFASTTYITAGTASTTNLIASASVIFQNLVGMLSSNGTTGVSARTLTGTANQIDIVNGDGTAGNPTFSLPSLLSFTNASTSQLSVTNQAWFGGTSTTTIDSAGSIVLPSAASLTLGGVSINSLLSTNASGVVVATST
ncbi:MAG: hypothetical protein Q8O70_05580, partial [Burkholderiales bacterium]|nr:hypothetical protein [Burkholderiales bacterium]